MDEIKIKLDKIQADLKILFSLMMALVEASNQNNDSLLHMNSIQKDLVGYFKKLVDEKSESI